MAAGLGSKNIFSSPFQKKLLAYRVRMGWDKGAFSDPVAMLRAYQTWKVMHLNEDFKRSGESPYIREKKWAEASYIELKALRVRKSFLLCFFGSLYRLLSICRTWTSW